MRVRSLVLSVAAVVLAGCASSEQEKADNAKVDRAGVSVSLHDKMVRGDSLSVGDVISLSQAGVRDDVLTRYIRDHGTVYRLTTVDRERLRKGRVSESVIDFMDHTDYRGPDSPWGP